MARKKAPAQPDSIVRAIEMLGGDPSRAPCDKLTHAALEVYAALRDAGQDHKSARLGAVVYAYKRFALRLGLNVNMFDSYATTELPESTQLAVSTALSSIPQDEDPAAAVGRVNEVLCNGGNGSHYTPSSLAAQVTETTLAPYVACISPVDGAPLHPWHLLAMRVLDPACGGGAFLVEVVSNLAARMIAACYQGCETQARQLIAINCIYGVDLDAASVLTAKCAITLHCRAAHMPSDWLDDNVKCGDALIGTLNTEQIKAFHWNAATASTPKASTEPTNMFAAVPAKDSLAELIDSAYSDAVQTRRLRMLALSAFVESR